MKQQRLKPIRGMLVMFVILTAAFSLLRPRLVQRGFDVDILVIGNLLLVILSLASYMLLSRSLQSTNPNSFLRSMYLSFIIKFFVIALAAFIYIMMQKKAVSKPSLIGCMVLYVIYTFMEVSALTKMLKQKRNA